MSESVEFPAMYTVVDAVSGREFKGYTSPYRDYCDHVAAYMRDHMGRQAAVALILPSGALQPLDEKESV